MGRKHMILQVNASHFSEFINSEFMTSCSLISTFDQVVFSHLAAMAENKINQFINYINEKSMEFKIAREADKRSRELQLKLGESYERLWVTIGLIQVLFLDAPLRYNI